MTAGFRAVPCAESICDFCNRHDRLSLSLYGFAKHRPGGRCGSKRLFNFLQHLLRVHSTPPGFAVRTINREFRYATKSFISVPSNSGHFTPLAFIATSIDGPCRQAAAVKVMSE